MSSSAPPTATTYLPNSHAGGMRMAATVGEGEGSGLGATSTAAGAGGWAPGTATGSTGALVVPVLHAD